MQSALLDGLGQILREVAQAEIMPPTLLSPDEPTWQRARSELFPDAQRDQ